MSVLKNFFKKVRILLEGSPEDAYEKESIEEYSAAERSRSRESGPSSSARLAERMANEYYDESDCEEDDIEQYEDSRPSDYYEPFEDEEETAPGNLSLSRHEEPRAAEVGEVLHPEEFIPEAPLPTRTEVTMREIERLSRKMDKDTARAYQLHLLKIKKETGAVSALTALRVLREYVDDDENEETVGKMLNLPDLSAK